MTGPQSSLLTSTDGQPPRLHLHHGPIDLVIQAWAGNPDTPDETGESAQNAQVMLAYRAATRHFQSLLQRLVDELDVLRGAPGPCGRFTRQVHGPVARRMVDAVIPHAARGFVTPMAAVAGAVADETISVMWREAALLRAYVNNGGDIAVRLRPGQRLTAGIAGDNRRTDGNNRVHGNVAGADGYITLNHSDRVAGIATSGWRGRSHSLGIADAVTVLAGSAAAADAAATLLANAVDLPGDRRIRREPAVSLAPDSDLGERLVTTAVPALDSNSIELALRGGQRLATTMLGSGQILAALFNCQGHTRVVGENKNPLQRTLDGHNLEASARVICL